jgi:carbonic anhydrase
MQFAVDVLEVEHIIVCGHYGCSGVRSALSSDRLGLCDNWLRHVQDVREQHEGRLGVLSSRTDREDHLCELNVLEQVMHVCQSSIVRDAWERRQSLEIHGWIYGLTNGLVRDLEYSAGNPAESLAGYERALKKL